METPHHTPHPEATRSPTLGIVLAAGQSTRMGRPKPLLQVGSETFIERTIRILQEGGCQGVLAVVAALDGEPARQAEMAGARIVVNEAGGEPIDSIRVAVGELPDDTGWVAVLPVDHPLVEPGTVTELIETAQTGGPAIVRPLYEGQPGHPGLFSRRTFPDLLDPDLEKGAHSVVERYRPHVVDLEVDDPGVIADLNRPEDLERWLGTR